jgi:hypothetical protein
MVINLPKGIEVGEFTCLERKKSQSTFVFLSKFVLPDTECTTQEIENVSGDLKYMYLYSGNLCVGIVFITNSIYTKSTIKRLLVSRGNSPEQFVPRFELERIGLYLFLSNCGTSSIVQALTHHSRVVKVD